MKENSTNNIHGLDKSIPNLRRLRHIAKKYDLPYEEDDFLISPLCFASLLDSLINKSKRHIPKTFSELKNKNYLTVVDVGCGYFRYGPALKKVLCKINPNIILFAIDKKKFFKDYSPATFIKGDIKKISSKLIKYGITHIDVLTVFNPFPGIPDITNIPEETKKYSLLIGCVDWNLKLFKESLTSNGYKEIAWLDNEYWGLMRSWHNNYNKFVLAVPAKR